MGTNASFKRRKFSPDNQKKVFFLFGVLLGTTPLQSVHCNDLIDYQYWETKGV